MILFIAFICKQNIISVLQERIFINTSISGTNMYVSLVSQDAYGEQEKSRGVNYSKTSVIISVIMHVVVHYALNVSVNKSSESLCIFFPVCMCYTYNYNDQRIITYS